ncbi:MAG: vWA domain-containing protein [Polyangiales bacterium]
MKIDRQSATLVPVDGNALIVGHQVAISSTLLPATAVGFIQTARAYRPVRAVPVRAGDVPVVAVSQALYDALDLDPQAVWAITLNEHPVKVAERVALEPVDNPGEEETSREDDVQAALRRHLGGAVLWCPTSDVTSLTLDLGGALYRVRALEPVVPGSLYTFDASTRVQRVTSSARVGVDIVILADCSGSMAIDDLDDRPADGVFRLGTAPIQRIESVRRALERLMRLRQATSGRTSKVALLAFNDQTRPFFPAKDGMVDFDANATQQLVKQFQDAIGLLTPGGGTDIGKALTAAQSLLVLHGQPGNERLIVLLSDGADVPQRRQGEGEILKDFEDPVTVMHRLHRLNSIRLHAIGVSTPEIFERWALSRKYSPDTPGYSGYCPNHALLHALMKVGGGDPARMGDTDVLRDYFTDLGHGAIRDLPKIPPWQPSPLSAEERERIDGALARTRNEARRDDPALQRLVYGLADIRQRCNERAAQTVGRHLFAHIENGTELMAGLYAATQTEAAFKVWLSILHRVFFEGRDGSTVSGTGEPYAVPEVPRLLAVDDFRDLGLLHTLFVAAPASVERTHAWALAQERLQKRLGRPVPADGGDLPWYDLQVSLLLGLSMTLTHIEAAFNRANVPSGAPAAPAAPAMEYVARERPLAHDAKVRVLDRIQNLSEAQFVDLVFRLNVPSKDLPGSTSSITERSIALFKLCEAKEAIASLQRALTRYFPN